MHITLSVSGHGHHPAAWSKSSLRLSVGGLPRYDEVVRAAEAATLDAVIFAPPPFEQSLLSSETVDVLQPDNLSIVGTLAASTHHIGLVASFPIRYNEPFNIARSFSALDNLTAGRAGWLVDFEARSWSAADFGHGEAMAVDERYGRAEEFLSVVKQLWDSWEDGAVLADQHGGMFADSSKIHPINHSGKFFSVRGPLVAIRPPQGHPPLIVDDLTPAGRRLAASCGDVLIADCDDVEEALALTKDMRAASVAAGREELDLRILMTLCPILAESDQAAHERAANLDGLADPRAVGSMVPRFVGTSTGLVDRMASWVRAGGCDGFNLVLPVISEDMNVLVNDVVPKLRRAGLLRTAYSGSTMREHLGLKRPASQFSKEVA
jgi:alkanesulfonate monooxygenase SsuD/methylene tetrahydromethanopterin reductase-like flavin-dependent oxidoreductase (luciferase family)